MFDDEFEDRETSQGPLTGRMVKFAAQVRVEQYAEEIQRILDAVGYSEAWVSDLSTFADFSPSDDELRRISETLGRNVRRGDLLVDVARSLRVN